MPATFIAAAIRKTQRGATTWQHPPYWLPYRFLCLKLTFLLRFYLELLLVLRRVSLPPFAFLPPASTELRPLGLTWRLRSVTTILRKLKSLVSLPPFAFSPPASSELRPSVLTWRLRSETFFCVNLKKFVCKRAYKVLLGPLRPSLEESPCPKSCSSTRAAPRPWEQLLGSAPEETGNVC